MDATLAREPRRYVRVNVEMTATAAPKVSDALRTVVVAVKDMSVSGLFFVSSRRFVVGMTLQIEIRCLGQVLTLDAIVRHCSRDRDDFNLYGIGVQYLSTLPVRSSLRTIAEFLQQEQARQKQLSQVRTASRVMFADEVSAIIQEKDARIAELTNALEADLPPRFRMGRA